MSLELERYSETDKHAFLVEDSTIYSFVELRSSIFPVLPFNMERSSKHRRYDRLSF